MNSEKGKPVASASETLPVMEMQQSLSDLFAMHHRRVLMSAYRITGSMADAEDVAQSVFLRLSSGSATGGEATRGATSIVRRSMGRSICCGAETQQQASRSIWH